MSCFCSFSEEASTSAFTIFKIFRDHYVNMIIVNASSLLFTKFWNHRTSGYYLEHKHAISCAILWLESGLARCLKPFG